MPVFLGTQVHSTTITPWVTSLASDDVTEDEYIVPTSTLSNDAGFSKLPLTFPSSAAILKTYKFTQTDPR